MLQAAWDLFLVVLLLGAGLGLGGKLLGGWRVREFHPAERGLFAIPLGLGALAIGATGLGALGLLEPVPLAALLLLGVVAGWKELRAATRSLTPVSTWSKDPGAIVVGVTGGVLVLAAAALLVGGLTPVTDWDSLMYHLRIPVQFLEAGSIHLPPDNLHAAYVGLLHMLYVPILALGGTTAPALLSGALTLLLGLTLLSAGTRLFGAATGACSAVLLWGSGIILGVGSTPRVDVSLALFLFLAHYALVLHLRDGDRRPWGLVVPAALAGLAVGVKYQALAYVGPLALLGLWGLLLATPGTKARFRVAGACSGAFLAAAAPMLLKNIVFFGAPLYPYLAERVIPPWIAAITGSTGHPPGIGSEIYWLVGQAREPFNLWDLFFRPGALTVEAEAWAFATNPAFLLLPLSLLFYRDRLLMALLLLPAAYLALILAPFEFTNLRYLIPVIPAFTLVSVEVARRLLLRVAGEGLTRTLLVVACVAAVAPVAQATGSRLGTPERIRAAVGTLPPEEYLAQAAVPGFPAYWEARSRVHEATGPDARILFLFEGRGLYFRRSVLQDNVLTNWPLLQATDAVDDCLEGTGITHLLVNLGALAYYEGRGMDAAPLRLDRFQDFQARCLEPVLHSNGFVLLEVRGPR